MSSPNEDYDVDELVRSLQDLNNRLKWWLREERELGGRSMKEMLEDESGWFQSTYIHSLTLCVREIYLLQFCLDYVYQELTP